MGRRGLKLYDSLSEEDKIKVIKKPTDKKYSFGGGEKRKSLAKATFPSNIGGKNVFLTSEVVETDFCCLFGNNTMKTAGGLSSGWKVRQGSWEK